MRKMKSKTILWIIPALTVAICAPGNGGSLIVKNAEAAAETTEDAAKQEESASEEANLKAPYFTKGVYSSFPASEADAEHTYFYVFYDEGAGYTEDGMSGIGLPFACEQSDESIVFHMGGADEES